MKYCKEKRKYHIITFMLMTFMVCLMSVGVCYADSQSDTYYMGFSNMGEDGIHIDIGQQHILFTSTSDLIDLENLEFPTQVTGGHCSFSAETSDLETLTVQARELLLYFGFAKLINLDIATDDEIMNQQHAQEMKLGVWESSSEESDPDESYASNTEDSDTVENTNSGESDSDESHANSTEDSDTVENTNLISEKWQVLCSWLSEKWQALCSWVTEKKEFIISSVLGCGIIAFFARILIQFLRTKRKKIFFGGANSAGKTTMSQYLMNPDASREDLIHKEPSQILSEERIIRDDTNRKLTLKAVVVDSPGHELEHIIDELSLTLRARIFRKKYAVIIIVAPTKAYNIHNKIDRDYINDQLITISKLWSAVLKAKRTVKPQTVTLFINKLDLYDDKEGMISEFSEHRKQLEKICNESNITFSTISGSILDKSGMTDLMQILKK